MIVGPPDSGKSTTAKILSAYAVRLDRTPIYVDLDVSKGSLVVPGAICACVLDQSILDIKVLYINIYIYMFHLNLCLLCYQNDNSALMPLSYFYGHSAPKANMALYQSLITVMATKIKERMGNDSDTSASGVIIDTHSWSEIADLEGILHCAKAFDIDVILVTDDRLYSTLKPSLDNSSIVLVKLPRSGGIVSQDAAIRRRKRKARIDEYFYGKKVDSNHPTILSPARITIKLSQYKFWQMGGLQLHEGIRVHGSSIASDPLQLMGMSPTRDNLMHSIVAVLHKSLTFTSQTDPSVNQQDNSNNDESSGINVVAGFLYVVDVEADKDTAVLLAPCPGALPSNNIVCGSIKWYE